MTKNPKSRLHKEHKEQEINIIFMQREDQVASIAGMSRLSTQENPIWSLAS